MPGKRTIRGFSLPDLLAVLIAIVLLAALALPALSQARDEAKITTCANNLKQLAEADLKYASEFNGKFFYDWGRPLNVEGKEAPNSRARWWDKERIGRYLPGTPLQWMSSVATYKDGKPVPIDEQPFVNDAGLGGGTFACPADEGAMRSYHQNFWASGIDAPAPPELTKQNLSYWIRMPGIFFNTNDNVPHDRLILFSEMLSLYPARSQQVQIKDGRATNGEFGFGPPDRNFAGTFQMPASPNWQDHYPTQIDYARHSSQRLAPSGLIRATILGGVNVAYADSHVAWREHTELYNPQTKRSTYQTLWSPVDQRLEEIFLVEANHEWKIE